MKLITILLLCIFSFSYAERVSGTKIGYVSYSTTNIGDDIQAIAARNFLPKGCVPIDREFISEFEYPTLLPTLVNGWFMHVNENASIHTFHPRSPSKSWPPSNDIKPFFISFHLDPNAIPVLLSPEGIEYFKKYAPIGARDLKTMNEFESRGIPSYFSGCLTLALDNPYKGKRSEIIYAVDIPKNCIEYIRSKTKSPVIEITHAVPHHLAGTKNQEKRIRYAQMLLTKYGGAKCVITQRLHAAMPCLAMETPVLFLGNPKHGRFSGLADLVHHCNRIELVNGEVDFDFDNPPENPRTYLELRESIIQNVTNWVKTTLSR